MQKSTNHCKCIVSLFVIEKLITQGKSIQTTIYYCIILIIPRLILYTWHNLKVDSTSFYEKDSDGRLLSLFV